MIVDLKNVDVLKRTDNVIKRVASKTKSTNTPIIQSTIKSGSIS